MTDLSTGPTPIRVANRSSHVVSSSSSDMAISLHMVGVLRRLATQLGMTTADHRPEPLVGTHHRSCTALILAGGGSRRFGSDKLDVVVGGATILEHVIRAVHQVTDDVTIVGRDHPAVATVVDPEPRRGPLAALAHTLATSKESDDGSGTDVAGSISATTTPSLVPPRSMDETVLVVGGDHPLVAPVLLAMLVDSLAQHDAAVPLDRDGRPQPLVAVYRRSIGDAMSAAVSAGVLGLIRFLESADVDWIEPPRWESVDPEGSSFLDVDTTADLQALIDKMGQTGRDRTTRQDHVDHSW